MLKRFYQHYQRLYHFWNWQKKREIHLKYLVADVWPTDPFITIDIIQRTIQGPGFNIPLQDLWKKNNLPNLLTEYIHSFQWLRNLRQYGDVQARTLGRDCILDWCEDAQKFSDGAWNIDVLGKRLSSWLKLYEFFAASANEKFRTAINQRIVQQSRYLESCFILEKSPIKRLFSLKGLILSQISISGFSKKLRFSLQWLLNELEAQILDDGMHYSRCPTLQVIILKDLLDIRSTLKTHKDDSFLQYYIEKMVPIVRLLRHGDGGIAYFNNGYYCKPELLDMVLSYADTQGKPASRAVVSGFERLQSEKTLILADMGQQFTLSPAIKETNASLVNGIYNFELSVGKQRILTTLPQERFKNNLSDPFNHNTSVVKGLGLPHSHTAVERLEQEGNKLISSKCSWNFPQYSQHHSRQIFLSKSGKDIRGQDTFSIHSHISSFTAQQPFEIFFHFHPTVQIQETTTPSIILLRIPTLGQWYFHHSKNVEIEKVNHQHFLEKTYNGYTLILKSSISYCKNIQHTTSYVVKWAFKSE